MTICTPGPHVLPRDPSPHTPPRPSNHVTTQGAGPYATTHDKTLRHIPRPNLAVPTITLPSALAAYTPSRWSR